MSKEQNNPNIWSKNIFFVLASIGGAVGLGSLWRFPYMTYENGGGAFFIPFIVCLLFVGAPLIIFEISLGKWSNGSVVSSFHKRYKRTSWIGWWVLINSVVIVFYYAVILAWSLEFVLYSINLSWENDTATFFTQNVISLTEQPFQWGEFNYLTFICLLLIWGAIFYFVKAGTNRISKVLLVTVPFPFLLLVILSINALTTNGGVEGVSYFFKPQLNNIMNINVWSAAASQVILSLGLGMGQLVAFSSKRKDNKGTVKSGFTIAGAVFLFSILAGITVFSTLGTLAYNQSVKVDELQNVQGIFLAFVTYPAAISQLPLAALWGVIFFLMLVLVGIDSVLAVVEANLVGFEEMNTKSSKSRLSFHICLVCLLGGIFFVFGNGLYWLDIVDHWIADYAILSIILLQGIVLGTSKSLDDFIGKSIKNKIIRKIFKFWTSVIVPIILLLFIINKLDIEFDTIYGGYSIGAILIGGWGIFFLIIIISIFFSRIYNRNKNCD
ncbi:MAG: sodium-dependent transporter [Bacteroidales bacterium]|jgi:NSS family neurotransmitter:Na+ symporter|nr:sodium-dependent transporter [Bacteroidales bacterium]